MENTIISNETIEERGINPTNIESVLENISEEAGTDVEISTPETLDEEKELDDESYNEAVQQINEMNFVELSKFKKDLTNQLSQLDIAKESAQSILDMQKSLQDTVDSDSNLADAIQVADVETDTGISDVEKFLENFDDTKKKMEDLLQKATEALKAFDDVEKTTSYLTNAMLEIIEKNIKTLEENDSDDVRKSLKYFNAVKDVYSDRTNVSFVLKKLPHQKQLLKRLKTNLKNKNMKAQTLKNVQKNVTKEFAKIFNVNQLASFENYLSEVYGNEDDAFYVQYALYLIYKNDKEFKVLGKHKYIENIIMNVLDICVGLYDLEGGKEYFNEKLCEIRDTVNSCLK